MDKGAKEFDKFIRDKISDIEFSGEKDSWELLNYRLNENIKTRRRSRLLKFIFSFVLVTSGALLLFLPSGQKKNNNESNIKSEHLQLSPPARSTMDYEAKNNNASGGEKQIHSLAQKAGKILSPDQRTDIPSKAKADEGAAKNSPSEVNDKPSPSRKTYTEYDLAEAVNTYTWGNDSFKVEITNVGKTVNSTYSDFAPVISADGSTMLFTSRRPVTEKEIKGRKQSMEHIYSCSLNGKKNKWGNTLLLAGSVNAEGRNNSAIGLSNDGQRMLLYRDDIHGNGDIYESMLKGTEWTAPVLMPDPINTQYHESSASISPDGKTLYFVSDRPGGIGARDIWYCTLGADGKWGDATNIGAPVNTGLDEEGIFIHPDGKTIYFSSKGHNGYGGYDVYRTVRNANDGKWSSPLNMGTPLNTPGDDVYFVMEAGGTVGYYTSSRAGGNGEKDIYKVTFKWIANDDKPSTPELVLVKGVIKDDEGNPLEASIEIIDNEKNEIITKLASNSSTGKYLVSLPAGKNYGIHVKANDHLFHSENFNITRASSYKEVDKDIVLDKIEVGKSSVLKNIFYDFDKATLRHESVAELERLIALMEQYPSLRIELSSHTDSKGTDDYNLNLSQARAQSVVDYLISNKVGKERLVPKGYGESKPVAPNEYEDGTDNPEGRQLNRRTEFKIIAK